MSLALPFDPVLALAVLGICICSLATLNTVSERGIPDGFYMKRQGIYFLVGTIIAAVLARTDYSRLRELKYGIFGLIIVSVIAVRFAGNDVLGARRAIQLPFFSFQASELGKVLLVVALAGFVVDRSRALHQPMTTIRIIALGLLPAALVLIQPDLGSSMVYGAVTLALLFVAGIPGRYFAAMGAVFAVVVVCVLVVLPMAGTEVLHGYQKARLTSFLHPNDNSNDTAFQQIQSRVAIGSGEKTGRGDKATQTSYNFLGEHHTDFVFAVVGERWGFMGAGLVLSLYALLIWRGLRALTMAKNLYGALIAGGITAMMLFQVFINVGMTVGIMPVTGIPLPLMSYGGSSVITTFLAIGLLQSVYAQGRASTAGKGRVLGF
ncbi:Peptidoglycan glycosyltransferase MrdB [Paraconexibacter sp. AEG42_29]|uniref:peptidoglycan glycosyltransferase n=2 Tax=Paraconexibacter sp. AEG42_29 TaxID=2997339 RepID=A0AAU7AXP7_9ACTN